MTHLPPSEESAQEEMLKELRAWCEEHQLDAEVYVARARGLVTSERDLDTAARLIIEYSPLPKGISKSDTPEIQEEPHKAALSVQDCNGSRGIKNRGWSR